MSVTLEDYNLSSDTIELPELVDYATKDCDVFDFSSLCSLAEPLRKLSRNRNFLIESYNNDLKRYASGTSLNTYTPQSMILYSCENFIIRANIWIPLRGSTKRKSLEERLFSYHSAHDHNFDFITVGYFGSGYRTEIYNRDVEKSFGIPGKKAFLEFQEDTTLPAHKVMAFRAKTDVHTQFPPEDLSISLNILPFNKKHLSEQQLFYNIHDDTIDHFADDNNNKRANLIRMAGFLGNDNSIDILDNLSKKHTCARTRAEAFSSLSRLRPEFSDIIADEVKSDISKKTAEYFDHITKLA
ncbi:hypothetical protein ABHV46_07330 [Asaia sp. BMEF1]|uniref:hypothetical protein n=1 Tax=Asaia sp. BMEF1 TaxID=3155932 RepID=UPI003F67EE6D